jgi:branched-chain amino acid transport system substrate-binding protein
MRFFRYFICALVFISSASHSEPIIIGLDADMSAVAVDGGVAIQRGAQIAIDEINTQGGVLGRPLVLEVRDHKGNPDRGLATVNHFAEQSNVIAILGGVHSSVVLHELDAIHNKKIIYLVPWAASTAIIDNGFYPNYVFRLSARDEYAGNFLVSYAKTQGANKIGLLLERTAWGRSNQKSMIMAANTLNLSIVDVQWFNWRETSMKTQMDSLLAAGVDAVVMVANAPEGSAIVKEMALRSDSERRPIVAHWGVASGAFVEKVGLENLLKVNLSVLQTGSFLLPKNTDKSNDLLKRYQSTYDKAVTAENITAAVGVMQAYDLVHLLALAINGAGTLDRFSVRDALERIDSYSGVVKSYNPPFSEKNHEALAYHDYFMAKYNKNGYLVPMSINRDADEK